MGLRLESDPASLIGRSVCVPEGSGMLMVHSEDCVAAQLAFKTVGADLMGTHVRVRLGRRVRQWRRVHKLTFAADRSSRDTSRSQAALSAQLRQGSPGRSSTRDMSPAASCATAVGSVCSGWKRSCGAAGSGYGSDASAQVDSGAAESRL